MRSHWIGGTDTPTGVAHIEAGPHVVSIELESFEAYLKLVGLLNHVRKQGVDIALQATDRRVRDALALASQELAE